VCVGTQDVEVYVRQCNDVQGRAGTPGNGTSPIDDRVRCSLCGLHGLVGALWPTTLIVACIGLLDPTFVGIHAGH